MKNSILVALNDSLISSIVIDHLIRFCPKGDDVKITLLHIFRNPEAQVDLMGKKFTAEQEPKMIAVLEQAKSRLVENGYSDSQIEIKLVKDPYETVTEGIIDQFRKDEYNVVFIGRKRMSKSEEFVLGDISIKLVRSLEGTAVVVVKGN